MRRTLLIVSGLSLLLSPLAGLNPTASAKEKEDKASAKAIQKQVQALRKQIATLREQEQVLLKQLEQAQAEQDEDSKVQGKWELVYMSERPQPPRWRKEIKGHKEVVWILSEKGEVVYRHHADFKLSQRGNVKLFTYFKKVVESLQGGPGRMMKGGTYIYRVDGERLAEVHGFLTDLYDPQAQDVEPAGMSLLIWRRVKE